MYINMFTHVNRYQANYDKTTTVYYSIEAIYFVKQHWFNNHHSKPMFCGPFQ